jgi:hypothetical protein
MMDFRVVTYARSNPCANTGTSRRPSYRLRIDDRGSSYDGSNRKEKDCERLKELHILYI